MNKQDFLEELEDILQRDENCNENDNLIDYDEWDSLAKMSLVAYFAENFDINLSLKDFADLKTVSDLIKLANGKIGE